MYRVNLTRCTPTAEWENLRLPDGSLADVSIVQLGATKLYIPMAWLRETGQARAPSTGITARTGGAGKSEPGIDQLFTASRFTSEPNCPGIVHVVEHQPPRDPRINPDFRLRLDFSDSSTGGPANDYSTNPPKAYLHNGVELSFSHDRRFNSYDLTEASTLPLPPLEGRRIGGTSHILGRDTAGWKESGRARLTQSFSVVDDSPGARDGLNEKFGGVSTLGRIHFIFWATETIAISYSVSEALVPPGQWGRFREPLRDLVRWLSTPPKDRDNVRRFALAPA